MNIYVCGNPLVPEDSLPLSILPDIRKKFPHITFLVFDPTEDLPKEKELIIIDTIINAKEVLCIRNIDEFIVTKALSVHDFDLGMNLKLAKKMGWVEKVIIIGIPPGEQEANEKTSRIIANLFSGNAQHNSCTGRMHE